MQKVKCRHCGAELVDLARIELLRKMQVRCLSCRRQQTIYPAPADNLSLRQVVTLAV